MSHVAAAARIQADRAEIEVSETQTSTALETKATLLIPLFIAIFAISRCGVVVEEAPISNGRMAAAHLAVNSQST
jgi:hypothetical protein